MLSLLVVLGCTQREPYYPGPERNDTDTPSVDTTPNTTGDTASSADTEPSPCQGRKIGVNVGDCAHNIQVPDENGNMRALWEYSGRVIVLDLSGFT